MKNIRIIELEDLLRKASESYYSGEPFISDFEFDEYRDELQELDPNNKFLSEVGAAPVSDSALTKVKHVIPMGSLKKINTVDEYNTWLKTLRKSISNFDFVVQEKVDGSSIELVYEYGFFKKAITRGDGEIGEDVTHSIKNARGLPKKLRDNLSIYVRAECYLNISDWNKYLSKDSANPRNAASGLSRRTSGEQSELLNIVAFDVVGDGVNFITEDNKIHWLKSLGFQTVITKVCNTEDVEKFINQIESDRTVFDFEIDGAVVKVNSINDQKTLGEHDGRPYWARAWKFSPMGGHTVLNGVEWSTGTHGTINPVAKVAPIKVGGTTIQNVTLHNMNEIDRLGVCIGDTVEVIRAGDVIPKVIRVVSKGKSRKTISIDACPACGSSVVKDGPKMFCEERENCPGSKNKRIDKWIQKREIMFLGDSALETLIESGTVSCIKDLYKLTVMSMVAAGLGQKMSEKILNEIEKSKTVTLSNFLGSMSLDMLGRSEAANLVEFGLTELSDWKSLKSKDLLRFDGFQQTKANRICNSVAENWTEIEELSKILVIKKKEKTMSNVGGRLSGNSFCFTGAMSVPRKELQEMVTDNGGIVKDSVVSGLDYLVADDPNSGTTKNKKAQKLGVQIISENDFMKMIQ